MNPAAIKRDRITRHGKKVAVTAHFPQTVDVSIRGASTVLQIDVRIDGKKQGALYIGSGSVAWLPGYRSVNGHRLSWAQFIEMMEKQRTYPITKKLGR